MVNTFGVTYLFLCRASELYTYSNGNISQGIWTNKMKCFHSLGDESIDAVRAVEV